MKTIAVTGGIGSGKSLLGKILEEKGFIVIDTDLISKRLSLKGNEGYRQIIEIFGSDILDSDSNLDKTKLAEIAFNDKKSLEMLNSIMHPLIEKELLKEIEKHINENYIFVLVPLLFETGWQNRFDKVWLVLADEKIRLQRAVLRDKAKEEDIKKRIKNQINHANMSNLAHNVLYNNSSEEEFKVQVANALKTL